MATIWPYVIPGSSWKNVLVTSFHIISGGVGHAYTLDRSEAEL